MPLSVKTKEHFRRRMALAGPKWGALMGGAVALAGVIMFTTSALHFVTVTDTHGGSTRILTVNQTEAAVLAQAGVAPLGENDRIVTSETPDGELMQVLPGLHCARSQRTARPRRIIHYRRDQPATC